jgi:hypothetical protein
MRLATIGSIAKRRKALKKMVEPKRRSELREHAKFGSPLKEIVFALLVPFISETYSSCCFCVHEYTHVLREHLNLLVRFLCKVTRIPQIAQMLVETAPCFNTGSEYGIISYMGRVRNIVEISPEILDKAQRASGVNGRTQRRKTERHGRLFA